MKLFCVFYLHMVLEKYSGDLLIIFFKVFISNHGSNDSSSVNRGFELRLRQTKAIKLILVASPLSAQHKGKRANTSWLGIRIMCPSGATCRPACLSELVL
jgi:hypothetical protein